MKSDLLTISPWKSMLFSAILFFCALSSSYADAEPTVTFTSAIQSQSEDSGNMTITYELSETSGLDVEIPFSVSGTATDPADYSITASPVTISAGSTQTTITISVVADAIDEHGETVIVDMGTPTNAMQGTTTQHIATITDDDDPPVVYFSGAPYTHNETPGSQTITVTLSAESGKVVTVNYATADGTATAGDDYTETSGTLTWNPGETGDKSFAVPILGDALDEEDETIELTLSSPGNCTIGGGDLTLGWDPNTESDPGGYKVYSKR